MHELYKGVKGHAPYEKCLKIGPSETPYPAFAGQLIHSCILLSFSQSLVKLLMIPEPKYKIHVSQVFRTKIHDSYMFCYYDSWFRFHPRS